MTIHAVIMAGGAGTRFWPASRYNHPKQLLDLWGETLIARTVRGLAPVIAPSEQWIITGAHLADNIARACPNVSKDRILSEPVGRNTAPCVGLAAALLQKIHGDTVFGVFPADHIITDLDGWARCLSAAYRAAESGSIVTLGIRPSRPETGYGYIRYQEVDGAAPLDARPVERFVEKPDAQTAQTYLDAGNYLWNGGVFVARTSTLLRELDRQMPELGRGVTALVEAWGTDGWDAALATLYPKLPSISVDYGIMEGAESVVVVPASFGWSDVGHWGALHESLPADAAGNLSVGRVLHHDSRSTVAVQTGDAKKLIVTLGLDDIVIVDTPDALLVCKRDNVQRVREIVGRLKEVGAEELL
ncbi:MAG: hypothetical protein AUK47_16845 [Deltaproteobacteria bacterium CG2_30_63_29]|nr:MAG: hypothetical protein AUK47_16845 [Deltaproteobacteria bacterium CG2_30_63_29]